MNRGYAQSNAPDRPDMKMNPRDWPAWLIVLIIVAVYGITYLLQRQLSDGWDTAINLGGGAIVLVLGVTLADQLMSRRDRWDPRKSAQSSKQVVPHQPIRPRGTGR